VERRLFTDLRWNARVELKNGAYLLGTQNNISSSFRLTDYSRLLLGVADEANVLAPGEVFCQIETEEGELRVITGTCIICRAPARSYIFPRGACVMTLTPGLTMAIYAQCIPVSSISYTDMYPGPFSQLPYLYRRYPPSASCEQARTAEFEKCHRLFCAG
jgi:hypothetical protein